jgi:type VI secretion system secreted protein Hcp
MAAGIIYLKLGDIEGEVTETGHKGWIRIDSMSFGMHTPVSFEVGGGAGRGTGKTSFQDVSLTKRSDKSSAKIMEYAATNKDIPVVKIEQMSAGDQMQVFFKINLKECLIASWQGGFGGADHGVESFSLNFTHAEWSSGEQDPKGATVGTPHRAAFDLKAAKKG